MYALKAELCRGRRLYYMPNFEFKRLKGTLASEQIIKKRKGRYKRKRSGKFRARS